MTRLPILSIWPNETLDSQSMPMWTFFAASLRPGISRSRPRGAPQPTKIASKLSVEQRLQTVDAFVAAKLDAEIEDVVAFLVDHRLRQAEFRDLRAHHAAGFRILIEHDAFVAHWCEIARHRERSGAAADKRNALAVLLFGGFGQAIANVVLEVGGDALEPADRNRIFFDAAAPAGRFARAIAGASENSRKHIRFPIDHVGVAIAAGGDQTDVFRNRRMRRTGPLAIHDLVEIIRDQNIGWFH